MVNVGDPVGSGLVPSLSRPGGNVTGLTIVTPEVSGKRLSRAAVLNHLAGEEFLRPVERAAKALGIRIQMLTVRGPEEIEAAFADMKKQRAEALLVMPSPVLNYQRRRLVDLAARDKLPVSYQAREFVEAGGHMSYGPDLPDVARRAATYVDIKILKGSKAADLPVEQPVKFEFVINRKTARTLGLTLAPSLLLRADQVIE
jgi:putative tryptophan/tyrosine transport system substrate-binding protein